ncbi:MAG: four helix bundle protein [Verrucomicrobia bacterium]|nr:four helix bundle protein [Verrucomicrobiota bacterium]
MNPDELKERTKQFALRTMKLADSLPKTPSGRVVAMQLASCGTSVGANYRAACRGRSKAEFVAKLGIVVEEADESVYWIELASEGKLVAAKLVGPLLTEAKELTAIFTASRKTATANRMSL